MAASINFELTERATLSHSNLRGFVWITTGLASALTMLLLATILYGLSRGTLWHYVQATYGITLVGLPFIIGLGLWAVWKVGTYGAINLTVNDLGLLFGWKSGKNSMMRWDDDSFHLCLIDRSSSGFGRFTTLLWEARRPWWPKTELSQEAFTAILDAAKIHGMSITSYSPSRVIWGTCVITRISAPRKK